MKRCECCHLDVIVLLFLLYLFSIHDFMFCSPVKQCEWCPPWQNQGRPPCKGCICPPEQNELDLDNFGRIRNINLNLCLKNNHGQNEFLSCEASKRMDSSYKGIVVKESFQANATLTKRWFPCNFDQNDYWSSKSQNHRYPALIVIKSKWIMNITDQHWEWAWRWWCAPPLSRCSGHGLESGPPHWSR